MFAPEVLERGDGVRELTTSAILHHQQHAVLVLEHVVQLREPCGGKGRRVLLTREGECAVCGKVAATFLLPLVLTPSAICG